jgi:cellulose biosynthesis protein BcsQ
VKTVAFFNNKGGVGKTTLVYHIAWMFHELGVNIVAIDLDPQSNLTAALVPEERLEQLWSDSERRETVLGAVEPLLNRLGDVQEPYVEEVDHGFGLVCGDLGLSLFEDRLGQAWPGCLDDNPANAHDAFRVMTAFYRIMDKAAAKLDTELAIVDVGPNLGALNRAVLVACDYVVVPLGADLFSLQGLRNLGPTLESWRTGWQTRKARLVPPNLLMPSGEMRPVGYIVLQHAVRKDRPVKAYDRWVSRIPEVYREKVLAEAPGKSSGHDANLLATIKHYRSLMPMAQDANKPIFLLKPADGAIGGHTQAVRDCYGDFERLARRIAEAVGVAVPA